MKKIAIKSIILTGFITLGCYSSVFAWSSKENVNTMDTHKTISVQALNMIKNDLKLDSNVSKNIEILENNMDQYKKGSVAPDFGEVDIERDYRLYQDHFFDPDSNSNFTTSSLYPLYSIKDTAESQTVNYMGQAVASWKDGDYSNSVYLLGKALHYFEDLNEPHHALNWTGGPGTSHAGFEDYVEKEKDNFKISSMGEDKSEYNSYSDEPFYKFLSLQSIKYAKKAKGFKSKVSMKNSWDDWKNAAIGSMKNAQIGTASVVYRFLQEVSKNENNSLTNPIGRFFVRIKTDNVSYAGTDDYMYFGMGFEDGKKLEVNCDVAGDDFTRNSNRAYQFTIKDSDYDVNKLNKIWIRKAKFAGDDWKGKEIELYMQGKRIFKGTIDRWMSGNDTYEISLK
ncbi:zinc dependent phospholipase C family protein [Clostridium oceanicum]|uniref:Phospholipase C n=1 Tax=Clostridium oceanicum TaxID=1543 RepID=A0ABP3UK15_9CLOT